MLLQRALPPGPAADPERCYTGLALGDHAPADRPYVVCNFVASADGKATSQGRSGPLGGPADRVVFHLLRTQVDGILAGTGTLRAERYGRLVRDPRLEEIRTSEGRSAQPLGVVISRSGEVPWGIPLFDDPGSRVALYVPPNAPAPDCAAQVIVHPSGPEMMLVDTFRSLRQDHGVRSLLCEGGPRLFDGMLGEGVVDELFLTLAPALVGGSELGITHGGALDHLVALRLVTALEYEGALFLRYARA
jgi:riboflavin biosynthesis pyrimidine reductase